MEKKKTLGLLVPERTAPPADSLLLNPKQVADWISSLPMANVGETSRQVFKTIVEFNRAEIPGLKRIKIAELFPRPIRYITNNLRKYYFDAPFPLSAKNRKIAVLNRELYVELALAYKVFVEDMVSGQTKFDRKLLIVALHRVMHYLFRVIYHSVIIYDPIPERVWKELHRLYAYAEQNQIQDLPIKPDDGRGTSSIAIVYRQALLLFCTAPYRMRQREIDQVVESLPRWSEQVSLKQQVPESLTPYQFVTHLTSDSPPQHQTLETGAPSERWRVLDTQKLVQSLRDTFEQQDSRTGEGRVASPLTVSAQHLTRQLIQALSSAPKREFVRTRLNFELKVAVGIASIHNLLTAGEPMEPPQREPESGTELNWIDQPNAAPNRSLYTITEHELTLDGFDESIQETIVASSLSDPNDSHSGIPSWATSRNQQEVETFACKTVNESAGGYCINWQGLNAPKIKIGEVIGIQSATAHKQFGIGISRWMRYLPGRGLQLGMQMLTPTSTAVLVRRFESEEEAGDTKQGLLLPEMRSSEQPATLILPTLPFRDGDILALRRGIEEHKIRLTRQLETTGAFAQFQFSYLDRKGEGGNHGGENQGDFDTIWSSL